MDISNDLSPWKANFSSGLFLEKQICIVLSECRCIHLLLVLSLPSWQPQFAARLCYCGLPVCCVFAALLVGSILCTWHQGEPSARSLPKMFLFSKLLGTVDGCSGRGNGAEQEPWSQRKQLMPSCMVQGLEPHPSLLSLDVPELQMDLILQINLNCKWV